MSTPPSASPTAPLELGRLDDTRVVQLPGPLTPSAPPRRRGSIRRTSHVDVVRDPGDLAPSILALQGAARDLVTGDGTADVAGVASLTVSLDEMGLIAAVDHQPSHPQCQELVGKRVGFGFRSAVKSLLTSTAGSLLGVLIDDLSGAVAPSGYAVLRDRMLRGHQATIPPPTDGIEESTQRDICAGWRTGGVAIERREHGMPLPFEEEPFQAPSLERDDDPIAWHHLPPLRPNVTRRIRRLDVARLDAGIEVDGMFRDIIVDPDFTRRVVHEYAMTAILDPSTLDIVEIRADPRALPFPTDCPLAAASAGYLVGQRARDLRRTVRHVIAGPVSCTHLNDLFRSLGDIDYLLSL
jgi:hypothetical protein